LKVLTDLVETRCEGPNIRLERSRSRVFGEPRREIDDWNKVPSFDAGEAPRRSTSSLDACSY